MHHVRSCDIIWLRIYAILSMILLLIAGISSVRVSPHRVVQTHKGNGACPGGYCDCKAFGKCRGNKSDNILFLSQ